jgi:hypothetical protein
VVFWLVYGAYDLKALSDNKEESSVDTIWAAADLCRRVLGIRRSDLSPENRSDA